MCDQAKSINALQWWNIFRFFCTFPLRRSTRQTITNSISIRIFWYRSYPILPQQISQTVFVAISGQVGPFLGARGPNWVWPKYQNWFKFAWLDVPRLYPPPLTTPNQPFRPTREVKVIFWPFWLSSISDISILKQPFYVLVYAAKGPLEFYIFYINIFEHGNDPPPQC